MTNKSVHLALVIVWGYGLSEVENGRFERQPENPKPCEHRIAKIVI